MKKPSTELFELIHALNGQEKRYFKLNQGSSKQKNHILLFNLIDKQAIYDEADIKENLPIKLHSQLPRLKKYLIDSLLKSMAIYQGTPSDETRLKEYCRQIDFLVKKRLYQQGLKLADKALNIAVKEELFLQAIELTNWRSKIYNRTSYNQDKIATNIELQREMAKKELEHVELFALYNQLISFRRKHVMARSSELKSQLTMVMDAAILKTYEPNEGFRSVFFYLQIYALYYEMLQDYTQSADYLKKMCDLISATKEREEKFAVYYVAVRHNLLNNLIGAYRLQEAETVMEELIDIGKEKTENDIHHFMQQYGQQLHLMVANKSFYKEKKLIAKIGKWFQKYIDELPDDFRETLSLYLIVIHFTIDGPKAAQPWLNKYYSFPISAGDVDSFLRIFQLIVYYEANNADLLPYAIRSAYRYLLKKDQLYQTEKVMLDWIRKHSHTSGQKAIRKAFTELKTKLEPLQKDPFEHNFMRHFNLMTWIESKINGTTLLEEIVQTN
jgi:hypothetical protein